MPVRIKSYGRAGGGSLRDTDVPGDAQRPDRHRSGLGLRHGSCAFAARLALANEAGGVRNGWNRSPLQAQASHGCRTRADTAALGPRARSRSVVPPLNVTTVHLRCIGPVKRVALPRITQLKKTATAAHPPGGNRSYTSASACSRATVARRGPRHGSRRRHAAWCVRSARDQFSLRCAPRRCVSPLSSTSIGDCRFACSSCSRTSWTSSAALASGRVATTSRRAPSASALPAITAAGSRPMGTPSTTPLAARQQPAPPRRQAHADRDAARERGRSEPGGACRAGRATRRRSDHVPGPRGHVYGLEGHALT